MLNFDKQKKETFIKNYVVDLNNNKKLMVRLPETVWKDKEQLQKVMKTLSVITAEDIEVERLEYLHGSFVYEVCIHDYLRFGFIERDSETMDCQQLTMKEKTNNNKDNKGDK